MANMWLRIIAALIVWVSCVHGQGKSCGFPDIKHGSIYDEDRYKETFPVAIGKYFYYTCDQNFVSPAQSFWTKITCTEEGWSPKPHCHRYCFFPWVEKGHSSNAGHIHLEGETAIITCDTGYSLLNNKSIITCEENGWSISPMCKQFNSKENCGPPPSIDNGDITSLPLKSYALGSIVEYQCQALYILQGNKEIICTNGQWSSPPKCLDPCVISEDIMNKHNIKFRWIDRNKLYVESGDIVEFECKPGHRSKTSSQSFRVHCLEGKLVYPTCELTTLE